MKTSFLKSKSDPLKPIGVFDSGLGGLTIVRELRQVLPQEDIIYFGDLARLPYGIKSKHQILRYSFQNAEFLLKQRVKTIIIACNSSSSAAHYQLKRALPVPVLDVIFPAAKEAVKTTRSGRIGVIATQATVEAGTYERMLKKFSKHVRVYSRPCPLFVPMVEEGWLQGKIPDRIIEFYLEPLKRLKVDVLMLGCTHYPLLKPAIQEFMGKETRLVDSAKAAVQDLAVNLKRQGLSYPCARTGRLKVYVSDKPRNFVRIGEKFLGEKLAKVQVIRDAA